MNSWSWSHIWIHIMNSDMNLWSQGYCEIIYQNSYFWIQQWIQADEFINGFMPFMNEFIYEFSAMNNIVKSCLNFNNEFTYENMIDLVNLKLFLIRLCFSEGNFYIFKVIMTCSLLSDHCQPKGWWAAATQWLAGGNAATADVGCCAQICWEDVDGRTWRAF